MTLPVKFVEDIITRAYTPLDEETAPSIALTSHALRIILNKKRFEYLELGVGEWCYEPQSHETTLNSSKAGNASQYCPAYVILSRCSISKSQDATWMAFEPWKMDP